MKKEFVPTNIKPETLKTLRALKKETGVAFYRIIADGVAMYARAHKARKPIKFTMGEK